MKIRAIPFIQHGNTMYSAVLSTKDLVGHTKVDVWHPNNDDGYQREVSMQRARKFRNYITTEVSPPAIIANIRDVDKYKIKYENGKLEIPDEVILWLVDGQHRVAGLRELLESSGEKYEKIEFPVVIQVGDTIYQEAKQFVTVNTSQKRVRTDLGERFLVKMANEEGMNKLILKNVRNIVWIPTAIEIVDTLNNGDSIWRNLIRLPNEPKGATIVSQKAFSDSLKPLLKEDAIYIKQKASYLAPILNRYWEAIKEVCPVPFEDPQKSVMLKTTGVVVLHSILPRVVSMIGNDSPEKNDFVKILGKLKSLRDDSKWQSPKGEYSRMLGQKGFLIIKMDLLEELDRTMKKVAA